MLLEIAMMMLIRAHYYVLHYQSFGLNKTKINHYFCPARNR